LNGKTIKNDYIRIRRGGISQNCEERSDNMRKVRWVVGLTLGLCLLMAVPVLAQSDYISGPFPSDIYSALDQGYNLLAAGKYDAAAVQFEKVTKIDNTNPFALNNLAAIQEQKGHLREAMALLQQATMKADMYHQKVSQTCFVAGLCTAVKPSKEMGATSTIAPIIRDNIAKLEPKIKALPPQPSSPPPMSPKK
jgi:tetratricopeptide (TPR) repeat protein